MSSDDVLHTALSIVTAPKKEPVALTVVRAHLRLDAGFDDLLLNNYLATARQWAESFLGRALLTQTLQYVLSRGLHLQDEVSTLPVQRPHNRLGPRSITLPRSPVQSIVSVTLRDSASTDTVLDPSSYLVDTLLEPARLVLDWQLIDQLTTIAWPLEHVVIQFKAGYADDNSSDAVPAPIVHAILLLVGFLYEHRGDFGSDEMPDAAERLLWPYRLMHFAA